MPECQYAAVERQRERERETEADNAEKRMANCWSGGFEKVRGTAAQIPDKEWLLIKAGPLCSLVPSLNEIGGT